MQAQSRKCIWKCIWSEKSPFFSRPQCVDGGFLAAARSADEMITTTQDEHASIVYQIYLLKAYVAACPIEYFCQFLCVNIDEQFN